MALAMYGTSVPGCCAGCGLALGRASTVNSRGRFHPECDPVMAALFAGQPKQPDSIAALADQLAEIAGMLAETNRRLAAIETALAQPQAAPSAAFQSWAHILDRAEQNARHEARQAQQKATGDLTFSDRPKTYDGFGF